MNIPDRIFKCDTCNKCYKTERAFIKHTAICNMFNQSKKQNDKLIERSEEIPSIGDLYFIVKELSEKYTKLQKDYDDLKRYVTRKNNKIDVFKHLNKEKPVESYREWFENLNFTNENLEKLFKNTFIDVYTDIIMSKLRNDPPIKCVDIKENTFYIYDDNSWRLQTKEEFSTIIKALYKKTFKQFKEWQDFNKKSIESGNIPIDEYLNKICKFMDNEDIITSKIKIRLYDFLKIEI